MTESSVTIGGIYHRDYSQRSATIGLTSDARTAGPAHAASAPRASAPMAIANVTGSVGFTSYNRPAMTRVAASAATLPRATPRRRQ